MLRQRILSSVVLAPLALAAIWFGGPWFAGLAAVAAWAMYWEWSKMTSLGQPRVQLAISSILALAAFAVPIMPDLAGPLVVGAAVLAYWAYGHKRLWGFWGALYVGLPTLALVWLREMNDGVLVVFWLMLVVWATDIGAYFAGRTIGGPKIMPVISPNKTWAGLIGGMVAAFVIGYAFLSFAGSTQPLLLAVVSSLLAIIAQVGDFFESWVKRHWGVKDSSNLIPGHGGVLDRVDGLLSVALVTAAVLAVIGRDVLQWQGAF